ncbi:MAG: hypothetical protein F6K16_37975 [Symploca sp. SIO2B6]|nr:hypothetical protein [Symploca sp. SIO2B6]
MNTLIAKKICDSNIPRIVISSTLFLLLSITGTIAFNRFEHYQYVRQKQGISAVATRTASVIEHELEEAMYGQGYFDRWMHLSTDNTVEVVWV